MTGSSLPPHVEDPAIEALAHEAEHTDEVTVQRKLFGWRELLSLIVPLGLLLFFARSVDWNDVVATIGRSEGWIVVGALLVYYASFPIRARRWAVLLAESGVRVRGRELLEILMLGWFVNCLVPAKLGDLYRSYLVKQRFGISLSRTVGVVAAERLLDVLVVFILLVIGGYIAFGRAVLPDLGLVYLSAAVLAVLIVLSGIGLYFVAPWLGRFFPPNVRRLGHLFREGVVHSFRALPVAGPLTVAVWIAEALRLALVLSALGLELPYSGIVFIAVASSLLTTVPLTPAGLGFVEVAIVYLLTAGFHLSTHDAIAVAVLDRSVSVLSVIVVGALVYVRHRARARSITSAA